MSFQQIASTPASFPSGPTGTSNQTNLAAQQINSTNKAQSSQALLIQGFANSVKQQPTVDFTGFAHLQKAQTDINTGLGKAKAHADTYLNVIQPSIITNISNIGNYYALHNAVSSTLPPGTTTQQWITTLGALKSQADIYHSDAAGVVSKLTTLHTNLSNDSAAFKVIVSDLNTAVNGDNGVLASINSQLSAVQSNINGQIALAAGSGLAIIGGVALIAVGLVAEFVTAGLSTALVIGGSLLVMGGIGGEVAAAISLSQLTNQKAHLLQQQSTLTAEVNLAQGISGAYTSLQDEAAKAVTAASSMENAWNFLSSDLTNLSNDLSSGIKDTATLRTLFLTAANHEVAVVNKDIVTIKNQMAGVHTVVVPTGQTVGDAIVAAARAGA